MLYRRPRNKSSILVDLSPLIDVVFLLLIFFMVSTRFKDDSGLDLSLPDSESRQKSDDELLTISIDRNQTIQLGSTKVAQEGLEATIAEKLKQYDNKTVVLKVDESVSHGLVVEVMDAAKSAGAAGLSFGTVPKKPTAKP